MNQKHISTLRMMQRNYSHIRQSDKEWEALEAAIELMETLDNRVEGRWPQAYWIQHSNNRWVCSHCGSERIYNIQDGIDPDKFCPECGFNMLRF